jgi:uncharacterized membrane protein HdeD (DUF308 family)
MNATTPSPQSAPVLANASKALLWEGIILLILGSVAIAVPAVFTLAIELVVGAVFLIGGITRLWRCLRSSEQGSRLWTMLAAVAAIVAGVLLLANPLEGAVTLTVIIAVLLLVEGGAKLAAGLAMGGVSGRGWIMFSGVVDAVLGVLLLMGLPGTAIWAIGLMVGISLIMTGWTAIMMSIGLKKLAS